MGKVEKVCWQKCSRRRRCFRKWSGKLWKQYGKHGETLWRRVVPSLCVKVVHFNTFFSDLFINAKHYHISSNVSTVYKWVWSKHILCSFLTTIKCVEILVRSVLHIGSNRKTNSYRVNHVIDFYELTETKQMLWVTFCLSLLKDNSEVCSKPKSNATCLTNILCVNKFRLS